METSNPELRLLSGTGATAPSSITHDFIVQRTGTTNAYPRVLRILNDGRVGIGNDLSNFSPASLFNVGVGPYRLTVDEVGETRIKSPNTPNAQTFVGLPAGGACIGFNASHQSDGSFACESRNGLNGGSLIWADGEGTLNFTALPSNAGASGPNFGGQYYYPLDVLNYRVMKVRPQHAGQVQIGAYAPQSNNIHADYRLAVDGKLVARSIFVTQVNNWADFVFAPTYALRPLPELETYLQQHRHLPAIPSAAEVEKNGVDLGEMNARLLQSLEELTLHVIELGKQNARLQAEVAALATRMNHATTPVAGN